MCWEWHKRWEKSSEIDYFTFTQLNTTCRELAIMKRTTSSCPGQSSWSLLLKRPSFGWALYLRLWASRRKKNKVPVNDFQFWLLYLFSLQHHRHHPNRWSPSAKNLQLSKILSLKLESYSIALHALPTSWILPFHFIFSQILCYHKEGVYQLVIWYVVVWPYAY